MFSELLRYTSVRELSLCNARLHLAVHEGPLARLGRRDDAGAELLRAAPPPACPAIVFLRLAGFQVSNPLSSSTVLRSLTKMRRILPSFDSAGSFGNLHFDRQLACNGDSLVHVKG